MELTKNLFKGSSFTTKAQSQANRDVNYQVIISYFNFKSPDGTISLIWK